MSILMPAWLISLASRNFQAPLVRLLFRAADGIRRQQDDGKRHVGVFLELFDDGLPGIRLLVQDDGLEVWLAEDARHGFFCRLVMTMRDEDFSAQRRVLRRGRGVRSILISLFYLRFGLLRCQSAVSW